MIKTSQFATELKIKIMLFFPLFANRFIEKEKEKKEEIDAIKICKITTNKTSGSIFERAGHN